MKRSSKVFLFVLVAEVIFLSGWGLKVGWDIRRMDEKVKSLQEEIQQIEAENKRLEDIRKKLDDDFFREKLAREKLGLARRNEVIYRIIPSQK